jgi:hypothetical protein
MIKSTSVTATAKLRMACKCRYSVCLGYISTIGATALIIHLFDRPQSKYGRVQSVGPIQEIENQFFVVNIEQMNLPSGSSGCGGP